MKRVLKTSAGIGKYHWDYQEFCYLIHVLSQTNNFKELMNLFIDLHTPKEICEIIRRVQISSYLVNNETYQNINEKTGASHNTISKINQKFYRGKSTVAKMIEKAGSFQKFTEGNIDERDWLSRMLDRTISHYNILK